MAVEITRTLPELTPEQKSRPYSKYYYRDLPDPDPMHLEIGYGPAMDPKKALPIQRLAELTKPGYFEVESGFCTMEDGTGYVALHNKMPGVSIEMIDWWMQWFCTETLRYQIWFKRDHAAHWVHPDSWKQATNPHLTNRQRWQGATHVAIEDLGGGSDGEVHLTFLTPEEMGLGTLTGDNLGIVGGNILIYNVPGKTETPDGYASFCHFIRKIPEGIEYRSRFYVGYHIVDKKPVKILPDGVRIDENMPRGLLLHNAHEYANFKSILPEIYQEEAIRP